MLKPRVQAVVTASCSFYAVKIHLYSCGNYEAHKKYDLLGVMFSENLKWNSISNKGPQTPRHCTL